MRTVVHSLVTKYVSKRGVFLVPVMLQPVPNMLHVPSEQHIGIK